MIRLLWVFVLGLCLNSCSTKKEILYLQDADTYQETPVLYANSTLQPNDVLSIKVSAALPDMAEPYNFQSQQQGGGAMGGQMMSLMGYLVSENLTITFPVLGVISVAGKTTAELANDIRELLESGGHLKDPTVDVRLLNAKFTVLGEVNGPGTYGFTEQNITLLQALGYAGDLTINGKRDDIILIRELEGVRRITRIDLTNTEYLNSEFNIIKPNDVIVVNQNYARVKSAGVISNPAFLVSMISLTISTILLLTR
jgi:polysaccharide export outer membrane protein